MTRRNFWLLLSVTAAAQLALASQIAPVDDELYYWCWSQDLQASYFDHPPLTAYLIRLSTIVFGNTVLGVRFFACACGIGTLALIGEMTDRRGIGWLLVTPMMLLGSILMTPDAPLLFFWAAYATWLIRMQRSDQTVPRWRHWILGGLILGLGGLSKYTMVFAVPGAFLSFWLNREKRASWLGGFALHLLIACVVVSPVLVFNYMHEFRPLQFQLNHAKRGGGNAGGFNPMHILEYFGTQLVLFGALPIVLVPWCIARCRELGQDARLRVCLWLFLFPSLFFIFKATFGRIEGNWPFICYVTLLPLGLRFRDNLDALSRWRRWALPAAFVVPSVVTGVILLHCFFHLPLPPKQDRVAFIQQRFAAAKRVVEWAKAEGITKIYSDNYQLTSQLRFQNMDSTQIPGMSRPSNFTLNSQAPPDEKSLYVIYYVDYNLRYPVEATNVYGNPQLVARFPETIRGTQENEYVVIRYERIE